jgi:type II secretory pathway component GspD/PulD (secretin)
MTRPVRTAAALAAALLFIPAARAQERTDPRRPASPAADKRLADLEEQLKKLTAEVQSLRQEPRAPGEVAVTAHVLKEAKAADAAKILETLYDTPRAVRVAHDARTNTVFIRADPATREDIQRVLQLLDQPAEKEARTTTTVFALKYARAPEAAKVIQEAFGKERNLRIAVDERTNSLVIQGNELDTATIKALLNAIDAVEKQPK